MAHLMYIDRFPLLPHEATGADCAGMIIPVVKDTNAELVAMNARLSWVL
jgi:hypothetical protein